MDKNLLLSRTIISDDPDYEYVFSVTCTTCDNTWEARGKIIEGVLEPKPLNCSECNPPFEPYIDDYDFSGRAHRLTVDCKDNATGYAYGNLVLACGVCNLLKNDFFTYEEFREIGQRYVKPRWMKIKSKE